MVADQACAPDGKAASSRSATASLYGQSPRPCLGTRARRRKPQALLPNWSPRAMAVCSASGCAILENSARKGMNGEARTPNVIPVRAPAGRHGDGRRSGIAIYAPIKGAMRNCEMSATGGV
jgi:hypothetical protein